jgi:hypothetical protein
MNTHNLKPTRVKQRWATLVAFGVPFAVYLLTMAPSITWAHDGADGGDLITAAYTLGVPHPPGYPTYCLLGWLFAHLPLRNVAWRLNFMSAVGAALAALGLCAAIWEWLQGKQDTGSRHTAAGLCAAWGLSFVSVFWSQALIAEVYAINAAFVSLVLWLSIRVHRRGAPCVALGLAWGLSMGTHMTSVALLPIVAWALAAARRKRAPGPVYSSWLLGALFGLSTYAYLPLRAGRGAVTWGNPTTPAGWWWTVSGALYRDYVFALPWEAVPGRTLFLVNLLASGFGPTGVAFSVIGVETLARRERTFMLVSGLSWLGYAAYATGYNTTDSYVYLIPALIIFAFWLGIGLAKGLNWLGQRLIARWSLVVGTWLACIGPLSALLLSYQDMDVHRDTSAFAFGDRVLAAAPSQVVLLTSDDRHTFTLWYFQHVLGQRPDLVIVDTGLMAYDWYRSSLPRSCLRSVSPEGDADEVGQMDLTRPVCEVIGGDDDWLRCKEHE